MDKETLSNYGWIVIAVLVLSVMIALATPFGTYIKTGVENAATGLVETSNKGIDVALLSTGTPKPYVPIVRNGIIPDGAIYTPNGGTAIAGNGTNTFPNTPQTGDTYEEGDYTYKYNQYYEFGSWYSKTSQNGWGVRVKDTSKTTYGEIISEIAGQQIKNMSYTFAGCRSLTTAPTIPDSVTNMLGTFASCTSLTIAPTIPSSATSMDHTFSGCTSLTTVHAIPNHVTDMSYTFQNCTSLTTAPAIQNSVTNMNSTFENCKSLTAAPAIPNSVTNMERTFNGCTSLTTPPDMSNANSVTNMSSTFSSCTSLTTAPVIPNSVTNMYCTFYYCTKLTTAPAIPNSVTNMTSTFLGCYKLTGTIEINANPTKYDKCLEDTQITGITGSCSQETKDALIATE